jgi:hypothetical protein
MTALRVYGMVELCVPKNWNERKVVRLPYVICGQINLRG